VRTVEALPVDVSVDHDGVEHDALDDARHQARIVSETLQQIRATNLGGGGSE
jgi:inhibitor of KinA sporulation pathway (predicted exonuclease)